MKKILMLGFALITLTVMANTFAASALSCKAFMTKSYWHGPQLSGLNLTIASNDIYSKISYRGGAFDTNMASQSCTENSDGSVSIGLVLYGDMGYLDLESTDSRTLKITDASLNDTQGLAHPIGNLTRL